MPRFRVELDGHVAATWVTEVDAPNRKLAEMYAVERAPDHPAGWTVLPSGMVSSVKALLCEEITDEDETAETIEAEARTDNYAIELKFDVVPWFKRASDAEIIALANLGSPTLEGLWGGDIEADQVAEYFRHGPTKPLYDYLATKPKMGRDTVGFECHVNAEQAMAWLRKHRPAVAAKIPQ